MLTLKEMVPFPEYWISMKKHEFYIFYSEDVEEKVHFKLVKTYANSFCIDEEDQSEIMGRVINGSFL